MAYNKIFRNGKFRTSKSDFKLLLDTKEQKIEIADCVKEDAENAIEDAKKALDKWLVVILDFR